MEFEIFKIVILFLVIIFSAIPLYFSALILGGRTSFIKTLYVMVFAAIISSLINFFLPYGTIIAFFILIWIYHELFKVNWVRAFFIWVFQIIFIMFIYFVLMIYGFDSFYSLFLFNEMF